jgi:hypothetical protein
MSAMAKTLNSFLYYIKNPTFINASDSLEFLKLRFLIFRIIWYKASNIEIALKV